MMGKTRRITSTTLITNVVTLWGRTKHTDLVNLKFMGRVKAIYCEKQNYNNAHLLKTGL